MGTRNLHQLDTDAILSTKLQNEITETPTRQSPGHYVCLRSESRDKSEQNKNLYCETPTVKPLL